MNEQKILNNFDQFRQQWTRFISKHGPYALWHLGIKKSILLHLSSLQDNCFQKSYRSVEEK